MNILLIRNKDTGVDGYFDFFESRNRSLGLSDV